MIAEIGLTELTEQVHISPFYLLGFRFVELLLLEPGGK